MDKITYTPIGFIHTSYTPGTGAPRQGRLAANEKGTIEILPPYRPALKTLDLFEYIIVLFHFDKVGKWEAVVSPPAASHAHRFGLFATRSPKRPNPIGMTVVKLHGIDDGILTVSGIEAFDGTPVLDIKPYLPTVDTVDSRINEQVEKDLGHHDEPFIRDESFYK